MSNRRCPKCGEEYSDTYRSCPFCEEEAAIRRGRPGGAAAGEWRSGRTPAAAEPEGSCCC